MLAWHALAHHLGQERVTRLMRDIGMPLRVDKGDALSPCGCGGRKGKVVDLTHGGLQCKRCLNQGARARWALAGWCERVAITAGGELHLALRTLAAAFATAWWILGTPETSGYPVGDARLDRAFVACDAGIEDFGAGTLPPVEV